MLRFSWRTPVRKTPLSVAIAALPLFTLSSIAWCADTVLPEVQVTDKADVSALTKRLPALSDTAVLLGEVPGVSLYSAGGVSSLPAIHGMADDRIRIKVDGMDLIASCPNHMNSPLSYIDPTNVGKIKVYAGITPVSVGGDSIGGSIVVDSPAPVFAAQGQAPILKGEAGAFYRSNGNANGANLTATYATESFNVTYAGATAESKNYKAASNFKSLTTTGVTGHTLPLDEVGSTAYKTRNNSLGFAVKSDDHILELKLSYQDVPYELYPNQRMDMLANKQNSFNLRYLGKFDWGSLEARGYQENVTHFMNFGADKQYLYGTAPGMPMNTKGKTTGASVKANVELTKQDLLRVGGEIQQYTLNDWWPPSGTGGMWPDTFLNINNGKRDRYAVFAEWEARTSEQWMALLGARYERVKMNAGNVDAYAVAVPADQTNFNSKNREKTDNNLDVTALARYTPNETTDIEFGVSRKVRSPNLYERYSWRTRGMEMVMNNFVGDGNGYVGDIDLKSEKAHTISATFDWHAADREWEFKATPYYTRVTDYIDAVRCEVGNTFTGSNCPATGANTSTNQFLQLKYKNQAARLYGLDLSGRMPLAKTGLGDLGLKGLLNYTNGKNLDTGDELYNIMPLNAKLTLTQQHEGWDNGIELVMVNAKDKVSDVRNEIKTPGYSIVNLRASYSWQKVRVDFGVENLFNRSYSLPLGGAYTGQGTTMSQTGITWGIPVPGAAQSLYAGVNYKF